MKIKVFDFYNFIDFAYLSILLVSVIDIPTRNELLMNKYDSIENVVNYLGCDSLTFLDLDKLSECMPNFNTLCTGCFNNDYKDLEW
jgi:glutamine phosphoribosylpyrophosphate amidotransferase